MASPSPDVSHWIEQAYPEGVPAEDGATLVALLRQRLGSDQTLDLVMSLVADDRLPAAALRSTGAPDLAAVRRVSARLAGGGWPLASPASAQSADDEESPDPQSALGRIVSWLREGYPGGVPDHDYIPLLALLERRLTHAEVKKVAKALRRGDVAPASSRDIAAAIEDVTHTQATPEDLQRVRERLAAKGWPVDFPDPL